MSILSQLKNTSPRRFIDFTRGFVPPDFSIARASPVLAFSTNNKLETVAANIPAFGYRDGECLGWLLESAHVNYCAHSSFTGVVVTGSGNDIWGSYDVNVTDGGTTPYDVVNAKKFTCTKQSGYLQYFSQIAGGEVDIGEGQTIQVPVMVDSEGFHVNLSGPLEQFAAFEVAQPATPYRVFAGWNSEPEPERVPTQVPRWAAVLALKSHNSTLLENTTLWEAVLAVRNEIISKPDGEAISMGGITIDASPDLKNRVVAALDDANYWERNSEMVGLVSLAIGLDGKAVDNLFIWAGKQQM